MELPCVDSPRGVESQRHLLGSGSGCDSRRAKSTLTLYEEGLEDGYQARGRALSWGILDLAVEV